MADWISVEEAAELCGFVAGRIRGLCRGKQILARKKGGMWWVDRKSLQAYVQKPNPTTSANVQVSPAPESSGPQVSRGIDLPLAYTTLIRAYVRTQTSAATSQQSKYEAETTSSRSSKDRL
jgi:hypothetical protein